MFFLFLNLNIAVVVYMKDVLTFKSIIRIGSV